MLTGSESDKDLKSFAKHLLTKKSAAKQIQSFFSHRKPFVTNDFRAEGVPCKAETSKDLQKTSKKD